MRGISWSLSGRILLDIVSQSFIHAVSSSAGLSDCLSYAVTKRNEYASRIFFYVFVGSACWRTPRSRLVFKWHVTTFEPRKPFVNPCLAPSFFFESLSKHCDSFCCCFPQKEKKTWCKRVFLLSLPSKNRRKQWQRLKKKITRTLWTFPQGLRLANWCGGQSRARTKREQTDVPLPSIKKIFVFFFGPPCTVWKANYFYGKIFRFWHKWRHHRWLHQCSN